jgi:hypothetical protein
VSLSKWALWGGLVSVVSATALTYVGSGATRLNPSEETKLWLKAHPEVVIKTYDQIAAQPEHRRRELFRSLSLQDRKAAWRQHLESFVLPLDQLTDEQVRTREGLDSSLSTRQLDAIRGVIAQLDNVFADTIATEERRASVTSLCQANSAYFSREMMATIFGSLGAREERSLLAEVATSVGERFAEPILNLESGLSAVWEGESPKRVLPECTCNRGSACSCSSCGGSGCWINWGDAGYCGCLWVFDCDGYCNR